MTFALETMDLRKTYRTAFPPRRVEAVRGMTLSVEQGEIFGFLGPNGAGKTTTIRMLMGLVAASSGQAKIFGHRVPSRQGRLRVGFLPESPYFYDYLSVVELVDLAGRLFGMTRAERRKKADELIALVGLGHVRNVPLKRYSKGMMQRAGIAQALVNDPELVVFDEPMSGLDPIGRKEVRDIILGLRERGRTVFFSSHILADVESIADRVAIVAQGQVRYLGTISSMVQSTTAATDIVVRDASGDDVGALHRVLEPHAISLRSHQGELIGRLPADVNVDRVISEVHQAGGSLVSLVPIHDTLEDVFLRSVALASPAQKRPSDSTEANR